MSGVYRNSSTETSNISPRAGGQGISIARPVITYIRKTVINVDDLETVVGVQGLNFKDVTPKQQVDLLGVYLSASDVYVYPDQDTIDLYSDIPSLSSIYTSFTGVSAQYEIVDRNNLLVTIPQAQANGTIDIIIANPAGYCSIAPIVSEEAAKTDKGEYHNQLIEVTGEVSSTLEEVVYAGSTSMELGAEFQAQVAFGDTLVIDPGSSIEETVMVTGLGSIGFSPIMGYTHHAGTKVRKAHDNSSWLLLNHYNPQHDLDDQPRTILYGGTVSKDTGARIHYHPRIKSVSQYAAEGGIDPNCYGLFRKIKFPNKAIKNDIELEHLQEEAVMGTPPMQGNYFKSEPFFTTLHQYSGAKDSYETFFREMYKKYAGNSGFNINLFIADDPRYSTIGNVIDKVPTFILLLQNINKSSLSVLSHVGFLDVSKPANLVQIYSRNSFLQRTSELESPEAGDEYDHTLIGRDIKTGVSKDDQSSLDIFINSRNSASFIITPTSAQIEKYKLEKYLNDAGQMCVAPPPLSDFEYDRYVDMYTGSPDGFAPDETNTASKSLAGRALKDIYEELTGPDEEPGIGGLPDTDLRVVNCDTNEPTGEKIPGEMLFGSFEHEGDTHPKEWVYNSPSYKMPEYYLRPRNVMPMVQYILIGNSDSNYIFYDLDTWDNPTNYIKYTQSTSTSISLRYVTNKEITSKSIYTDKFAYPRKEPTYSRSLNDTKNIISDIHSDLYNIHKDLTCHLNFNFAPPDDPDGWTQGNGTGTIIQKFRDPITNLAQHTGHDQQAYYIVMTNLHVVLGSARGPSSSSLLKDLKFGSVNPNCVINVYPGYYYANRFDPKHKTDVAHPVVDIDKHSSYRDGLYHGIPGKLFTDPWDRAGKPSMSDLGISSGPFRPSVAVLDVSFVIFKAGIDDYATSLEPTDDLSFDSCKYIDPTMIEKYLDYQTGGSRHSHSRSLNHEWPGSSLDSFAASFPGHDTLNPQYPAPGVSKGRFSISTHHHLSMDAWSQSEVGNIQTLHSTTYGVTEMGDSSHHVGGPEQGSSGSSLWTYDPSSITLKNNCTIKGHVDDADPYIIGVHCTGVPTGWGFSSTGIPGWSKYNITSNNVYAVHASRRPFYGLVDIKTIYDYVPYVTLDDLKGIDNMVLQESYCLSNLNKITQDLNDEDPTFISRDDMDGVYTLGSHPDIGKYVGGKRWYEHSSGEYGIFYIPKEAWKDPVTQNVRGCQFTDKVKHWLGDHNNWVIAKITQDSKLYEETE